MRDYRFKGYDTKYHEWRFGGFVCMKDYYGKPVIKPMIIEDDEVEDYDLGYSYEVDPDSVCQFVGRKDVDGQDIYEHDLIFIYNGNTDEEDGMFEVMWCDKESAYFAVGDGLEFALGDLLDWEIKVVGNKYSMATLREEFDE